MAPHHPTPTERLVVQLLDQGRCPEALELYRAAEPGSLDREPRVLLLIATAAARTADYDLAERLADQASSSFEAGGDQAGRLRATNVQGGIAFERGLLADAAARFERVLGLASATGDGEAEARAANNLASVAHLRGWNEEAERLYRRALGLFEAAGDRRGQAQAWHNLSIVLREAGRLPEAVEASGRAHDHATAIGDPSLLGMVLAGQVDLELARGNREVSGGLDRARHLAVEAGDALGEVESTRLDALRLLREARPDAAAVAAEAARGRAREIGCVIKQGECAAVGGEALERIGQALLAGARREEAELIFQLLGARRHLRHPRSAAH
jgi:hypothetical protein